MADESVPSQVRLGPAEVAARGVGTTKHAAAAVLDSVVDLQVVLRLRHMRTSRHATREATILVWAVFMITMATEVELTREHERAVTASKMR